ncbi:MAG: formylmethanofuran dehydrogenase [Deltaproteobacteria bacterium]|nr:formylmethanofuran dehydrogenase [Deltaproteobacteria bacterium]
MEKEFNIPEDLQRCIDFHGHICPGMIYGYKVANEALTLLDLMRSIDEEVVVISENDSCSVDAFQIILGTTAGKGNLIINNYGKNVYTVFSRKINKAYRFSRKLDYIYSGPYKEEFETLENKFSDGTATPTERARQKRLKTFDLLDQPFENIFETVETELPAPSYAELSPSVSCAKCKEMTMKSKMIDSDSGLLCIPCSKE